MTGFDPIYFSNQTDPAQWWTEEKNYLWVVLIPRRWWSVQAWKLAIGFRRYIRLMPPTPKYVSEYKERV